MFKFHLTTERMNGSKPLPINITIITFIL